MSFRLRHRATFDVRSVTDSLRLRATRLESPPQWDWAWPLHVAKPKQRSKSQNAVHSGWVSSVRTVAVADDASAIAFVSHDDGRVALLTHRSNEGMRCTDLTLDSKIDPELVATSVTFFSLNDGQATTPQSLAAVGYASGNVAIFDVVSSSLLVVTRPVAALQVRRLRFYPAFHLLPSVTRYPAAPSNTGLFAVLAWSGTLASISGTELTVLLSQARKSGKPVVDLLGAGWVVWKTNAQDAVLDAALCGSDPNSICELDVSPPEAPLRVMAAGVNPPIAAYTVTADPAFSARDAAKRAASSVFSAARGFIFSRIASVADPAPEPIEDARTAVTGIARLSTSWADDGISGQPLINFGDVRDTARRSVTAVLTRGRKPMDIDVAAALDSHRQKSRISLRGEPSSGNLSTVEEMENHDNTLEPKGESILMRQRSRFSGEEVVQVAKLPQNARIVERLAAAPLPCSLLATSDTLGRIFVQDSRDLCVLRILKGYREGQVAWLAQGGPLLAVYAPRLNVLELHEPLKVRRSAAFQLQSGSMLVQSTAHHVFCVSPDGRLHELMKTRKQQLVGPRMTTRGAYEGHGASGNKEAQRKSPDVDNPFPEKYGGLSTAAADYEMVGAFVEAVKRRQTSAAVDCLQQVESSVVKVAHLMATLVTCTEYVRTEVHIALASKAAQIASNSKNKDLSSRFEAHGRLAEAFALLAAEMMPEDPELEQKRLSKYGHRLLEDELAAGLVEFAVDELTTGNSSRVGVKRMRTTAVEDEIINCERFLLSHSLVPCSDPRADLDYVLTPRRDLSESEKTWIAKAYFSRLLEIDSAGVPTQGREHPATRDVFLALEDLIGLTEVEITRQFATFILNMPLLPLLNTHSALYASPIRCAIGRLRGRFAVEVVDAILIEECEKSSRIPNAVLLLRLCDVSEDQSSSKGQDGPFTGPLDRLREVLLYRKLIAGSPVPRDVYSQFTGKRCTGVPGDAERHAVFCLVECNDFERASKVLMGMEVSRRRQSLDWHESASVSEAALHACRRKAVILMTEDSTKLIPASVVEWVRAATPFEEQRQWDQLLSEKREATLRQLRGVLISAHQYLPDSSVDAVRCLQLAEAISALIELEVEKAGRLEAKDGAEGSTDADAIGGMSPKNTKEQRHGAVKDLSTSDPQAQAQICDRKDITRVPVASVESTDMDGMLDMDAVPLVPNMNTAPAATVVAQETSEMEIEEVIDVGENEKEYSDEQEFLDARSSPASDIMEDSTENASIEE